MWANEPWVDQGTETTDAGKGFVDWGSSAGTAEDIPSTPPTSTLNDDFFSTITSVSGQNVAVATAPGVTATPAPLYHDDTPAWNAALAACSASNGCNIALRNGTSRVTRLATSTSTNVTIVGQSNQSSILYDYGNGGAKWCHTNDTGEGQMDFDGTLILSNFGFKSDNSSADCMIH
ncbi:MAG: hypothetical protein JO108_29810, partial [Acidobacteriaceae bacterium]|nr:hypothetical protein [Acidobacteriaceae bacterium]